MGGHVGKQSIKPFEDEERLGVNEVNKQKLPTHSKEELDEAFIISKSDEIKYSLRTITYVVSGFLLGTIPFWILYVAIPYQPVDEKGFANNWRYIVFFPLNFVLLNMYEALMQERASKTFHMNYLAFVSVFSYLLCFVSLALVVTFAGLIPFHWFVGTFIWQGFTLNMMKKLTIRKFNKEGNFHFPVNNMAVEIEEFNKKAQFIGIASFLGGGMLTILDAFILLSYAASPSWGQPLISIFASLFSFGIKKLSTIAVLKSGKY